MQLDGHHLYVNDVLSPWLFPFKFNAFKAALKVAAVMWHGAEMTRMQLDLP
jgi:hypothetical protein